MLNGLHIHLKMRKSYLKEYWGRLYNRFVKIRGNPNDVASGFALGIMVGMTPFLGLHIIISVLISAIFKWSKVAACAGAQITNVFTAPFFYGLTYWVGLKVTGNHHLFDSQLDFSIHSFLILCKSAPVILWALCAGGIVIGFPLSVLSYFTVYHVYKKYQDRIKSHV